MSPRITRFTQEVAAIEQTVIQELVSIERRIAPTPVATYQPDIIRPTKPTKPSADIFEQALARANSHEQPAPVIRVAKRRKVAKHVQERMTTYATGALAILILFGFLSYYNLDGTQFKRATSQAGFSASMPSYRPAGYSVANYQVAPGIVAVNYMNKTNTTDNGQSYALTEKPSTWNSETLLTNLGAGPNTTVYSTLQVNGRTVYIYGQNQAAWVNGGILYQIQGHGLLAVADFGKIAASL